MSTSREAFLQRVRQALQQGGKAGAAAAPPQRGTVGYQGAGADPVARFCAELTAAGGQPHVVRDRAAAAALVIELAQACSARRALLGQGEFIDSLGMRLRLQTAGLEVVAVETLAAENCREPFFAADVGITGVDFLIAETGSVALCARPGEPRSCSLLPPIHVAVAHQSQILPDLFDLFARLEVTGNPVMPSCLSLITGPSKTGDIELRLVTGVHGPGEIHVLVVQD